MYDVIIVGGGYAGMAAALQLVRAYRKVLVVDAGQRRNRFARHSHGFLGQDGVDPAQIAAISRQQLQAYSTLSWVEGHVAAASGTKDNFQITLQSGEIHPSRRLLFATGVKDRLPEIPGLAQHWGKHVFHCPYCHGYELNRGKIGVIATGEMSLHQAQLLPEWGDVTFLTNDALALDESARQNLLQRGVTIEETAISHIADNADVHLADGRVLQFAGMFTATLTSPATSVAIEMGCETAETPMGTQVQTANTKETSISGVFACGDTAKLPHSVSLAVGDGAWAGAQIHRSLVWPDS